MEAHLLALTSATSCREARKKSHVQKLREKNNTRGRPIYCQKSVCESSNRHARWKFGRILFIVVHVWRASWTTAGVILKLTVGWNGAEAISRRSELEWVSFWERQNHTSARSRRKTEDEARETARVVGSWREFVGLGGFYVTVLEITLLIK